MRSHWDSDESSLAGREPAYRAPAWKGMASAVSNHQPTQADFNPYIGKIKPTH
jgi:hypothetical protein